MTLTGADGLAGSGLADAGPGRTSGTAGLVAGGACGGLTGGAAAAAMVLGVGA